MTSADGQNASPESWLADLLPQAREVAIQSGFLTGAGTRLVRDALWQALADGAQVTIVVGGRENQVDAAGLEFLAGLVRAYPERARVFVVNDSQRMFSAKTYAVRTGTGAVHAWLGSANLTLAGFTRNLQAGVVFEPADLDDPLHTEASKVLTEALAWSSDPNAVLLDEGLATTLLARAGRLGPLSEHLAMAIDEVEEAGHRSGTGTGIATGFGDLDRLTGGLTPGELTVVGGDTGVGKSLFVTNIALHVARAGRAVAVFSLQSSAVQVAHRLNAAVSRVHVQKLRTGQMTETDWSKLAAALTGSTELPLYLAAPRRATLDEIRAQVTSLRQPPGLVVIDGINQLTWPTAPGGEEQALARHSEDLRVLAGDLNCPVVVTAALNRNQHQRVDRRPQLQNLRGSGQIADAADLLLLLHREDHYESDSPRAGEADIIVAKHRHGPTDVLTVAFQGHYARFIDIA